MAVHWSLVGLHMQWYNCIADLKVIAVIAVAAIRIMAKGHTDCNTIVTSYQLRLDKSRLVSLREPSSRFMTSM